MGTGREAGFEIDHVLPGSPAQRAGLVPGDLIVAVNGHKIRDSIDFLFYRSDASDIALLRKNRLITMRVFSTEGEAFGIELKPFRVKTCTNRCIFCFVRQLPKGLRKTLYVKDEDYRMSFLYGNYVTLTNLSLSDKKRIVQQKLSPLYISVHTTNRELRNTMLGNQKAPDIMKELSFFKDHKIKMNCQIVLCPGYNDGRELERTIRDLCKFYPYMISIAVVPVGLTAHRKASQKLAQVESRDARAALDIIDVFRRRFLRKHGDPIVYGSDELYIKADREFPPLREYGELHQVENGVGMVPQFLHQARHIKIPVLKGKKHFVTFTGTSFYPILAKFIEKLTKSGISINVVPIENSFFGASVTVAGLLTGRDVMKKLSGLIRKDDLLLIPDIVFKDASEEVFLDDVSRRDLTDFLGASSVVIPSNPKGLIEAVALAGCEN